MRHALQLLHPQNRRVLRLRQPAPLLQRRQRLHDQAGRVQEPVLRSGQSDVCVMGNVLLRGQHGRAEDVQRVQ